MSHKALPRNEQDFDDRTYKPGRSRGKIKIGKYWTVEYTVAHDGTELVIENIVDVTGVHGHNSGNIAKPLYEVVTQVLADFGTTFEAWVGTYRDTDTETEEEA